MALLDALGEMAKSQGKTIAQIAIAWLLADPVITSPIIGANTVEQLNEILGASSFRLTVADKKTLDDLTAWQMQ
jgi:aryl-alcohol dehydrogenase-like predicted oxidoreductase